MQLHTGKKLYYVEKPIDYHSNSTFKYETNNISECTKYVFFYISKRGIIITKLKCHHPE